MASRKRVFKNVCYWTLRYGTWFIGSRGEVALFDDFICANKIIAGQEKTVIFIIIIIVIIVTITLLTLMLYRDMLMTPNTSKCSINHRYSAELEIWRWSCIGPGLDTPNAKTHPIQKYTSPQLELKFNTISLVQ